MNEITIKNFWPQTVSFLDFWWKRLAGILEFNYSCPDELSEKNHLFHKISYFHESFRTLGEKCSKLCPTLFFGRAIEKATYVSRGSLWRKTKGFKCFKEECFFIKVYGLWSEKFALSEKKNSLGSKNSILSVQRNVLGENQNLCMEKLFFFCKILSGNEAKYFGLLGKLFPAGLSSFRSTSAEEGFREKFLEKSSFSLFPDLEQRIDYWKDIKMNVETLFYVSGGVFIRQNILFKVIWYIFSCISSDEL